MKKGMPTRFKHLLNVANKHFGRDWFTTPEIMAHVDESLFSAEMLYSLKRLGHLSHKSGRWRLNNGREI